MVWLLAAFCLAFSIPYAGAGEPIRLHPENGRYFLFRDRPVTLVGSSEHYGAVINLDFDYIRYLDETHACGLNFVRIFSGAYREMDGSFDIEDNTLSPLPGRSIAPWKRSDLPGSGDGGNKFDLSRWDPAYFYRLRDFVSEAGKRDIVVELTFFSAIYDDGLWGISPLNGSNNINGAGDGGRAASHSPTGDLVPFQRALARKCVAELKGFDNVIYEICNEPYMSGISQAWQDLIIGELAAAEADFPNKHLIAQNVFNYEGVVVNPNPAVSIFNFHYAKPAAAAMNQGLNKPIGDDETGFAGQEDFPYRREAWEFMFSGGALFNHLDYSFTVAREDGVAAQEAPGGGGPAIRRQLGVMRWFLEELPLVNLTVQSDLVTGGVPSGGSVKAMGVPGSAYGLYLRGGSQANLVLNLPAGTYRGQWIDPRSGLVAAAVAAFSHPGGPKTLASPPYGEDVALRLSEGDAPPPVVALTSPSYNRIISGPENVLELSAEASVEAGELQGVEFFDGGKSLGVVTAPPFNLTLNVLSEGAHVFRARAVATDGRQAVSPPTKVSVLGRFESGVNLNGGPLMVDGEMLQSESEAAASGLVMTNAQPLTTTASLTLYPPPDQPTAELLKNQLLRASSAGNAELGLSHPIPNGYYDVFLFIVETQVSYSRDMRVTLEDRTVARGIGDLARGEWHKYGPYRVRVEDGMLDLGLQQESKGVPKIAALSIYQADPPPEFPAVRLEIGRSDGVIVLSYPPELNRAKVEVSDDLAMVDGWKELEDPVSSFSDRDVIAVPVDRPTRFFRLRMD